MDKVTPDFITMKQIWELVYTCNKCYMSTFYDNCPVHLFLATSPKGYNSSTYSMIYKEEHFSIIFVLEVVPEQRINIEINRGLKSSLRSDKSEKISLKPGEYQFEDEYDEEKFGFITSCLMNGAKELMRYYYKNKRF